VVFRYNIKITSNKLKIDKLDFFKIKKCFWFKGHHKEREKTTPQNGRIFANGRYLQIMYLIRDLYWNI